VTAFASLAGTSAADFGGAGGGSFAQRRAELDAFERRRTDLGASCAQATTNPELLQPRAEADLKIRFNNVSAVARSFPFIEPRSSTTTISRKTDPRNLKTNSSALFDIACC
jgi:hypothetical protein